MSYSTPENHWSIESFGQLLKADVPLNFNMPPAAVDFPVESRLSQDLNRLLWEGRSLRPLRIPRERVAVVATNEGGELMLSRSYEEGGGFITVAPRSGGEIEGILAGTLPKGWGFVGLARSHPLMDSVYNYVTSYARIDGAGHFQQDLIDFMNYLSRYPQIRCLCATSPRYTAVLVATQATRDLAEEFVQKQNALDQELRGYPPLVNIGYYLRHPRELYHRSVAQEQVVRNVVQHYHGAVLLDQQFKQDLSRLEIVYYQYNKPLLPRRRKTGPLLLRRN